MAFVKIFTTEFRTTWINTDEVTHFETTCYGEADEDTELKFYKEGYALFSMMYPKKEEADEVIMKFLKVAAGYGQSIETVNISQAEPVGDKNCHAATMEQQKERIRRLKKDYE